MKSKRNDNFPLTVEKALKILEHIAEAEGPLGISELSKALNIHKSTVYRIIQSLLAKKYVDREPLSNKYRIGFKILELNAMILKNMGLRTVAMGHMERLAQETMETVGLATMDREGVIYLDQTGGEKENVRIHFPMGSHMPFHCTGTGKAMLAFMDHDVLEDILNNHELSALTPNTIASEEALREELEKVRANGYAFNNGEYQEEVRVVAAPIFDSRNKLVGSIGVAALTSRMKLKMVAHFGELVKMTAAEISRNLGCDTSRQNSPLE